MPDDASEVEIYVSAFFCQSVIRDKRDLLTAVRLTNAYTAPATTVRVVVGGVTFEQTQHLPLTLQAVISFTSDGPVEFNFVMRGFDPEGIELTPTPPPMPCKVLGGPAGYVFNVAMNVPTHKEGDLRFDVYVNDQFTTRMFLRIKHGNPPDDPRPDQAQTPHEAAS